jgi:pyrroloquinoline quinone (PQQ) biosynthesis protein C
MVRGTLNKRLVVGYLVEEYHLVASAASHISPIITATDNERLRMMFCDYLGGEYWHCLLLKKGLLAAGISEDELAAADPLAGTLAVINLQRHIARTDILAYSACLSINEGGDQRSATAFEQMYDLLTRFVPPEALAPSREHAVLDFEDAHETLGAEPFVEELALGAARQRAIYRAVRARIHTQGEQHREMAAFYGAPDGPLVHSYDPGRSRT